MPRTNFRFCCMSVRIGILASLCYWSFLHEVGANEPDTDKPHALRVGVKECAACHTQPGILYPEVGVTQYLRLTEAAQWFEKDKHAQAYHLVRHDLNPKTREILQRLGWQPDGIEFQRQCLTCHVGLEIDEDFNSTTIKQNLPFGVQCESCHGKGSIYTQTDLHQQATWRTKSSEEKRSYGMQDLANPVTAAKVCLSCHQGDLQQGRFVTHAMYAAGHPPLPPFELQTFLDAMPPHWGPLEGKPYATNKDPSPQEFEFQREVYLARMDLDPTASVTDMKQILASHFTRAQRSRIGQQVTHDSAMNLILNAAEEATVWGDYALYDCMGCHQTLTYDKLRYRPPGRIPGRAFPSLTIDVSDKAFGDAAAEWNQAFNKTPFGDSARLRSVAPQLQAILLEREGQAIQESRHLVDATGVREWLSHLIHERRERVNDYWVARQTGWMVLVAVDELVRKGDMDEQEAIPLRNELTDLLRLDLRVEQKQSVLDRQAEILKVANTFDSRRALELLESLVRLANEQ